MTRPAQVDHEVPRPRLTPGPLPRPRRHRLPTRHGPLPVLLVGLAVLCLVSTASAQSGAAADDAWEVPRTAYGHPDLQGNWTNATLTPFEREEDRGPVYTREEVEELEQGTGDCPPRPGTVECGREPSSSGLGGQEYDEVYWDRGSRVAVVRGEPRTSLITRPSDGRIPPLTPEAEERLERERELRSRFGSYDHPELRPLGERCLVSFGSSLGPPMIPNGAYNNNYTIVQNADHVLIMAEMVHDVRIIRLGEAEPLPDDIRPWFGDSRGHWEGETLVVETTNLNPDYPFRGVPPTEHTKVTERFTRADQETILYEFTVEDPTTYTEPWGGEIPFKDLNDRVYEYACHEGNYGLEGVLSGARYQERLEEEGEAEGVR